MKLIQAGIILIYIVSFWYTSPSIFITESDSGMNKILLASWYLKSFILICLPFLILQSTFKAFHFPFPSIHEICRVRQPNLEKGEIISEDCELLISWQEIVQYISLFQSNSLQECKFVSKLNVFLFVNLLWVSSMLIPRFLVKMLVSKGLSRFIYIFSLPNSFVLKLFILILRYLWRIIFIYTT